MNIQWYPGHMTDARRKMTEEIRQVDLVIELLDARIPLSGKNPDIDRMAKDKKRLLILNKCDLAAGSDEPVCDSAGFAHQTVAISALRGTGLYTLRSAIASCGFGLSSGEGAIVTSARHYQALCDASEDLSRASDALSRNLPGDLLAEDLRAAISSLGSIFGEITTDELLGEIFGRFCIGK
jgi:tRNA U34 5-carboxymethylaminomethyl modifying GTPase MnmE/TrmE